MIGSASGSEPLDPQTDSRPVPWRGRVLVAAGLLAVLWVLLALDETVLGDRLVQHGIRPREWGGLLGILFAPWLHADWSHLIANSLPFFVLATLVLLAGVCEWIESTILIVLLGGLGTWLVGGLFSDVETVHVGASGLIFGWFGYLVFRGWFRRTIASLLIALVVGFLYGGMIWGVLPGREGISWEGHLCGFLAGALAAWLIARFGDAETDTRDDLA